MYDRCAVFCAWYGASWSNVDGTLVVNLTPCSRDTMNTRKSQGKATRGNEDNLRRCGLLDSGPGCLNGVVSD